LTLINPCNPGLHNETPCMYIIYINSIHNHKQYVTGFQKNSGSRVHTGLAVCPERVLHCSTQSSNGWMCCSFAHIYGFVHPLCLLDTLCLAFNTLNLQNSVQCYECSQIHSFQYVSPVNCTNSSDVEIYAVISFTNFLSVLCYCNLCQRFL
jgi:hypothetical protein